MRRRVFLYGGGVTAGVASWQFWRGRGMAGLVTIDAIGDQVQRLPKSPPPEFVRRTGGIQTLHKSNRDCYIKAFHPDGTLTFTSHAAT